MAAKVTEREVVGWISEQINRLIDKGDLPFEISTVETRLPGGSGLYPDIVIWNNRTADDAFCFFEFKQPNKLENELRLPLVASELKVSYAITWNFQIAKLFYIESDLIEKKSYPTYIISDLQDWLRKDIQIRIIEYLKDFLDDLKELKAEGHLHNFRPDKYFFISLLQEATKNMEGYFFDHLSDASANKGFAREIEAFVIKQGLPELKTREINELIATQWVYGLITKILFYYTVRRHYNDLPDLYIELKDTVNINEALTRAFTAARQYDWHAVFDTESDYEKIGIPKECGRIIIGLLEQFEKYNFNQVKEDIIGEIFEGLIPETQKHRLGQYFTREDLVDLIVGFVVDEKDGHYCDPTCGSGTFLNRVYSKLKCLSANRKKHGSILRQVWGIDIAKFPAELATSSLFRQDLTDYSNFPRIQAMDFFDVKPEQVFEFPPPRLDSPSMQKIQEPIPYFDGMVGNFPFIRQEIIEKKIKGYKKKLTRVLAEDWYRDYPGLFSNGGNGNKELKMSGQADMYAYLFIHAARFLKPKGRMGFITSNSYLDVGYGYDLKKFFMDNFKIVAIVASWAEPWFDYAAVNTIFTVLEKCGNRDERMSNPVSFIKLKKNLADLISHPDLAFDEARRWGHIEQLVARMVNKADSDTDISSTENDDFRVRRVRQEYLCKELEDKGRYSKWGIYIRAPEVYFNILDKTQNTLKPIKEYKDNINIRFGIKTGINDFFYLTPTGKEAKKKSCIHVQNGVGWSGEIESDYLKPVVTHTAESQNIKIDRSKLNKYLFVCNRPTPELKKMGHLNTWKYINWGENQKKNDGILWPNIPSVKERTLWYSIELEKQAAFLLNRFIDKRFYCSILPKGIEATDVFFVGYSKPNFTKLQIAFLNSTLYALFIEIHGRANMGDGVLTFYGPDIKSTMTIDNEAINEKKETAILGLFTPLTKRPIGPIDEELRQKDRQEFDKAVLSAIGIDPKIYLPQIYNSLLELVHERLELPKMRKKMAKVKIDASINEIKSQLEYEIIPNGLNEFPEYYLTPDIPVKDRMVVGENMKIGAHFFGKYEIVTNDGKLIFEAKSLDEANYAICSRNDCVYLRDFPVNPKDTTKIVNAYEKYIKEIYQKLTQHAFSATHDHNMADRIALELLREHGYMGNFKLS